MFLGLACGYLPSIIFDLIIDKVIQRNIIFKMCVAEFCKLLGFILILSVIFKFLPIEPIISQFETCFHKYWHVRIKN